MKQRWAKWVGLVSRVYTASPLAPAAVAFLYAALVCSLSYPFGLASVPDPNTAPGVIKEVGYLPAINWTVAYLILFPLIVYFLLEAFECVPNSIGLLAGRGMLVDGKLARIEPNTVLDDWNAALKRSVLVTAGLFVVAVVEPVIEWWATSAYPLIAHSLNVVPEHEYDWSVGATMSRAGAVVLLDKGAAIRRLFFLTFLLSSLFSYTQPKEPALDCLNLLPQEGTFSVKDHRDKCFGDQLGFANVESIQNTEKLFGLSPKEIVFIGCDIAPFSARIDRSEPQLHFEILYNSALEHGASAVAILHELGHVYQLKHAGSHEGLLSSAHQDLERVELGADYLSGVAIGRLHMSEKDVDVGLALVGSYTVHSAPHGLPHERSAAFNYGVTSGKAEGSVTSLYGQFQDDDYGQIKHRW